MRVLHVLHTSLPYLCGYSIRSDYILRFQQEQGICNAVVTSAQHPNDGPLKETLNGIDHYRTPALKGSPPPVLRECRLMSALHRRVAQAAEAFKPDLIHAHSPMLVGYPGLWTARKRKIPFVYEVRDLWENASVDRGKFAEGSPQYAIARGMETRLLHRADQVVTICEALRAELAPRSGDPEKVKVVANGVDASRFQPVEDNPEARARWGLPGKAVLSYLGTFQPYEGLDVLLRAMPRMISQAPNAHLVIAGSGGVEPALHALTKELRLESCVTFTGRLPHSEVDQVYRIASLMVYPRILTRVTALTTPLKPLEAMAMARPVAVSDVAAMLELVRDGETGVVFKAGDPDDLADRCAELLKDPEQANALGKAARSYVERERSWPARVVTYADIYRQAAAKR
jgi:PEP-CTERM/exosortase A-associated glycosyltransferase